MSDIFRTQYGVLREGDVFYRLFHGKEAWQKVAEGVLDGSKYNAITKRKEARDRDWLYDETFVIVPRTQVMQKRIQHQASGM